MLQNYEDNRNLPNNPLYFYENTKNLVIALGNTNNNV